MKKIAIVSCYFQPNYGSMIQALATQMVIDKLGYENETIDISGFNNEIRKEKIKYYFKSAISSDILLSKMGMAVNVLKKKVSKGDYYRNTTIRYNKFVEFSNKNFRLSKKFDSKADLGEYTKDNYSSVVVGSDQLWLPANIVANYYTLNWVPENINTIAYATSFGQSILPKDCIKKAEVFLKNIKHIGVREESGQKLVNQISGRNVPIVCDPTLLFTGDEWMTIQNKEPLYKEPYIFSYFLGNNPAHRRFVQRLKEETGYKIVALIHIDEFVKIDEEYADDTPYDVDPSDFLNLIRNAKYVCTDSFHCSVFSLQYEKCFFAFRRFKRKTASSTNSRLDTLFKISGVDNQILNGDEIVSEVLKKEIDYNKVRKNLNIIREKSILFLKKSIEDEGITDL